MRHVWIFLLLPALLVGARPASAQIDWAPTQTQAGSTLGYDDIYGQRWIMDDGDVRRRGVYRSEPEAVRWRDW
jgi:hypothetical protein